MFTLEEIIGDIIFISFRDKSFLSKLAIPEEANHFKIRGQDQLGLWVEHPKLTFRYTTDKEGKPIDKENQKLAFCKLSTPYVRPMEALEVDAHICIISEIF